MLTIGSLFSGVGGLEIGLEWAGLGPVKWQVEKDPYARKVLAKHWPDARRYDDVCTVGRHNLEPVDLICGGFPCQDISFAGKGAGLDGERSGLWFEFARIIGEMEPRYVVVENVAALLVRGLGPVLGTLASLGYDAVWDCIPAAAVGAHHRRDRVFIVARRHADSDSDSESTLPVDAEVARMPRDVADTISIARQPCGQGDGGERRSGCGAQGEPGRRHVDGGGFRSDVADPQREGSRVPSRRITRGTATQGSPVHARPCGSNVADANSARPQERTRQPDDHGQERAPVVGSGCGERKGSDVADSTSAGLQAQRWQCGEQDSAGATSAVDSCGRRSRPGVWLPEPNVGRVADGVPNRTHRLRCLGNSVVPQVAEVIGRAIVASDTCGLARE